MYVCMYVCVDNTHPRPLGPTAVIRAQHVGVLLAIFVLATFVLKIPGSQFRAQTSQNRS